MKSKIFKLHSSLKKTFSKIALVEWRTWDLFVWACFLFKAPPRQLGYCALSIEWTNGAKMPGTKHVIASKLTTLCRQGVWMVLHTCSKDGLSWLWCQPAISSSNPVPNIVVQVQQQRLRSLQLSETPLDHQCTARNCCRGQCTPRLTPLALIRLHQTLTQR